MWNSYPNYLKKIYWGNKRVLWSGSYFVASCGEDTIEQLKQYVENQHSPDFYLCFPVLYWSAFDLVSETESLQADIFKVTHNRCQFRDESTPDWG